MDLCGDGRSDSPGHSAKYGTYSLIDEATGHITDFSFVQVSEVLHPMQWSMKDAKDR